MGGAVPRWRAGWAYVAAVAIGVGFVWWLMPVGSLFPARPIDAVFEGDNAQSVIGQRYFLADGWHWPLLVVRRLAAPGGTNVAFTDSLPLVLLPLKVFAGWLPAGFFVRNGWVAAAWVVQPVAAVFALRSAGERRFVPAVAVAAMSVSMPSLLARFGQMSLCTHALLLVALGLYFRLSREVRWGDGVAAVLVLAVALLVHPYLLVMSAALLAAAPVSLAVRGGRAWVGCAGWVGAGLLVVGGVAAVLGYGGAQPAPGYGVYSMNVLAPFVPGPNGAVPVKIADPTGGQAFEGYQYLGGGVLLLVGAAGVAAWGGGVVRWRGHAGLVLALVALSLVAVSAEVYVGGFRVTRIPVARLPSVLVQFRASARFFWPVSYALLIGSTAVVGRRWRGWGGVALLVAAAGLQVADTQRWREIDRGSAVFAGRWVFDEAGVAPVLAASRALTLWPPDGCGMGSSTSPAFMQMLLLGSETVIPTSTMYAARFERAPTCEPGVVLGGALPAGELRAIVPPARVAEWYWVPDHERACWWAAPMVLCARERPAGAAAVVVPGAELVAGRGYRPGVPGFAEALGEGWDVADGAGVWTLGSAAALRFRLMGAGAMVRFRAEVAAVAPRPGGVQEVRVVADGQVVAVWTLADQRHATVEAMVPAGTGVLRFEVGQPTRPVDRRMNEDVRLLGMQLVSFEFGAAP